MAVPTSPRSDTPLPESSGWPSPPRSSDGWDDPPPRSAEPRAPRPNDPAPQVPRGKPGQQSWSVPGTSQQPPPPREPWFEDEVVPVEVRQPLPPPRPAKVKPPKARAMGVPPDDLLIPPPPRTRGRGKPATPQAARQARSRRPPPRPSRHRPSNDWSRVAPVYDVNGPRVRYGVAWFVAIAAAVTVSPATAAIGYAAAAGLAARQTVQAWRGVSWQSDLAAGLAVVPVLATIFGTGAGVAALVLVAAVAIGAGMQAPNAGLRGTTGRLAAAGVMLQATLPVALAGGAMVVVRAHSIAAALILVGLVSAYEMGDFLVGSAASNPIEGPLAGGAAVVVVGFPLALLLIEPFDVMGAALLGIVAVCCPVGQWLASAILPRPDADAPALRRIDTLLLLAPVWAIAAGVF